MRILPPVLLLAALCATSAWAVCPDCDGDGFAPPADCDDGSAAIHPGATEVCDGLDNNCDALIDGMAGCDGTCGLADRKGGERRLSDPLHVADVPAIVWTGSEFAVAWKQAVGAQAEILFRHLDPNGLPLGPSLHVALADPPLEGPRLAWNGSGYGLTWVESARLHFVRLDASGQRLGNEVPLDALNVTGHAIEWTGSGYGVAWDSHLEGSNSEIFFARLDRQGNALDPPLRITNAPSTSLLPDLAWMGNGFGLTWYDLRDGNLEIYFARLAADGTKITGDVRVTNTSPHSSNPKIEWSGSDFGLVWNEGGEIYFARLDPSGNPIGSTLRVTNDPALSNTPALVRTGNGYGVAWYDLRDGNAEIYFQRVTAAGLLDGLPVRVTSDPDFANNPAIAWSGQSFGIAWHDERLNLPGVYFTRVGCGCLDVDGDGFTSCRDCNEARTDIHPGAVDVCDGLDQDCDGIDGVDQDLDLFSSCTGDCDDLHPQAFPAALEICDSLDNDCNGLADDPGGAAEACDLDDGVIWVSLPNQTQVTWPQELGFDAFNEYRGDLAVLRATGVYTQDPFNVPLAASNCGLWATSILDDMTPPLGHAVFYLVTGTSGGVEGSLGTNSAGLERPNDYPCP